MVDRHKTKEPLSAESPLRVSSHPAPVILFATHAWGGVKELWESLAEGLRALGHETELWALYPYHAEDREDDAWRYVLPRKRSGLLGAAQMLGGLGGWLRRHRPPVIISAMPAANVLLPALARLVSPATRIIATHHTPVDTYHPLLTRLDGWTGGLVTVAAVVSVSAAVERSLAGRSTTYRTKSRVIRNALPPAIEAQLAELRQAADPRTSHARRICAVGRLAEQKNYPVLLRAMALLPDVTLDIIGSGPDSDALAALAAQLGIADRVHFLGQRPRRETLAHLAGTDCFVQISRWEGHSLALIEAAKLGLPLVVSDAPVQIEGVTSQDGICRGLIAGLDDPEAVAAHIRLLLDDGAAYRKWSEHADILAADCRFDTMASNYASVITDATTG